MVDKETPWNRCDSEGGDADGVAWSALNDFEASSTSTVELVTGAKSTQYVRLE